MLTGFPPSILDADYLNDKYAALAVNESQYFENKLRNKKYTLLRGLQKYGKPVNKTRPVSLSLCSWEAKSEQTSVAPARLRPLNE